ncbi:MAG: chemotaxis protein CheA [Candidatus Schekmanbacteria bacterium]|nr:MAG: chemotaxis protein CheA [Candidatus Schekmanbacteria bacterium]
MSFQISEKIKKIIDQINALLIADSDDSAFNKELNEKLIELKSALEKCDDKSLHSLIDKLNKLIEYEEKSSNSSNSGYEEYINQVKLVISEIENGSNDKSSELIDNDTKKEEDTLIDFSEEDYELYNDFIAEALEHLQNIEESVIGLENNSCDEELLNSIFRAFHTIKGNSAFLNLTKMNILAHKSENLLDAVRQNKINYNPSIADVILESVDILKKMISTLTESIKQKKSFKEETEINEIIAKIEQALNESSPTTSREEKENLISEENKESLNETDDNKQRGKQFTLFSEESDKSFLSDFIEECNEYISNAEASLLELETDPNDKEAINTIFRAFHTIKGTSSFLGITPISELSHKVESLLIPVRDGKKSFSETYADISLQAIDYLKELLKLIQISIDGGNIEEPEGFINFLKKLDNPEELLSVKKIESDVPRLGEILVGEGKISKEDLESAASKEGNEPIGVKLVKTGVASVKDVAQAIRKQKKISEVFQSQDSSVRVRTDRLDRLIDMVGELVIAHSMVVQDTTSLTQQSELQKKLSHCGKIVRELQDLSLAIRMVPLKPTFQKMTRLVRDLSRKSGKAINFITNGEETEIDRNMVDILNDPLVHLLRNAVDHGIEDKETRQKMGKEGTGTVKLIAYHSGGNVVLEIIDDGKGLDKEKIINKAINKGIFTGKENLSDNEIFNCIFEPGFSTAEKITDISGRGVGLDVVKKNIESLRGKIIISSEKGKGCKFTIRLPLTMAITDGMIIKCGNHRFIIPTINISMSFKLEENMISTIAGKGEIINLRNQIYPFFRLSEIFKIPPDIKSVDEGIAIIINDTQNPYILLVDGILGQQQVVAKSLGNHFINLPSVSGGAILADGRVGLILDTSGLFQMAKETKRKRTVNL